MIPTITTERLYLRPFTLTDIPAMHQILSGKDVLRYFPTTQAPSLAGVERMIQWILNHWQERGYGLWALAHKETNALLGRCGLSYIAETAEVEVDFILDRAYWGQGLATEAGRSAMQFGFDELGLSTIIGIVHPENLASQRVLRKIGLQFAEEAEYFGMACYKFVGERPSLAK
ncbi:MAG: GNAT family N-acetyltransferase [Ardenticatenaceae bacterium]|nr:GNAT family N-acetyltransferase [Ardenticatenaceae bacterium]